MGKKNLFLISLERKDKTKQNKKKNKRSLLCLKHHKHACYGREILFWGTELGQVLMVGYSTLLSFCLLYFIHSKFYHFSTNQKPSGDKTTSISYQHKTQTPRIQQKQQIGSTWWKWKETWNLTEIIQLKVRIQFP